MKKIILALLLILILVTLFGCDNQQSGSADKNSLVAPDQNTIDAKPSCGDGICQPLEKSGKISCLKDCKTDANVTPDKGDILGNFSEINSYDVTPEGLTNPWRPEIQKIGDKWYYAFNKQKQFAMLILDEQFEQLEYLDIFSGTVAGYSPTDIRSAKDDSGNFWYAFETASTGTSFADSWASKKTCELNTDSLALYSGKELVQTKSQFAYGCVLNPDTVKIAGESSFVDKPASDDPTPFFYNGNYYVLNRHYKSPNQTIREFDSEFNIINTYSPSIADFVGNNPITQNTVLEINGDLYLIGGVQIGSPGQAGSSTKIDAFKFASDLNSFTKMISLTNHPDEADTRVTAARVLGEKLFISYQNHLVDNFAIYLEAFDIENNFASLGRTLVTDEQTPPDSHNSIEVADDNIYIAYIAPGGKMMVKEYSFS
ncbi:MAG: hypothetical protein AABW59_05440 [archaeon]